MLVDAGLLIVSNPTQIGKVLSAIHKYVRKTLYIQLLSTLSGSAEGGFHPSIFTSWPKYSKIIQYIYCQAANHCQDLDVRILLSELKYHNRQITTHRSIEMIIFDKVFREDEIQSFVKSRISNKGSNESIVTLDSGACENIRCSFTETPNEIVCDHTVLGGTFDRLHIAHKLLLSEAALRAKTQVTIGITAENMVRSKLLWELIETSTIRKKNVEEFLTDICPELTIKVALLFEPLGSATYDPSMQLIIVSTETMKGAKKINEIRETKGLNKLEIIALNLMDEPFKQSNEETKISSSTLRIRLLGNYLKFPVPNSKIPSRPYVVGLTGGIASGKSSVARRLSELGALTIDCDKVAHKCYEPGKPCYNLLIEHFGKSILSTSGDVDRKILGEIVFKNPHELEALNLIVWPAIAEYVNNIIYNSSCEVAVIEAAILIPAGWNKFCHEIWATIIPREEAKKRLLSRNGLTEEQADKRLDSQPLNTIHVKAANIVLCTLWEYEDTKRQVDKAWGNLQKILKNEQIEPFTNL